MSYSFAENSLLKKEKTVGVKEEGVVGRAFTHRQVKVVQRAEKYEKFSREGRRRKHLFSEMQVKQNKFYNVTTSLLDSSIFL